MTNLALVAIVTTGSLGLCAAFSPAAADAAAVLPFFSKPYPYRYAYDQLPPRSCYVFRPVQTLFGVTEERVWDCGEVVNSRY